MTKTKTKDGPENPKQHLTKKRVERLLKVGENVIAVRAEQTRPGRAPAVIGALRVEFSSGEPLTVQTGADWHAGAQVPPDWEKSASGGSWTPPDPRLRASATAGVSSGEQAGP